MSLLVETKVYSEAEVGKTSTALISWRSGFKTIQFLDGFLLPESVAKDVAALAQKKIPLPVPFNYESFESAKKELISLARSDFDKNIFEKATSSILHISFPMFLSQMKKCIAEFNQKMGQSDYEAIVVAHKSNEWATQLALKFGLTPPGHLQYFEEAQNCYGGKHPSKAERVAIIDDCSYGGGQAIGFIKCLIQIDAFMNKQTGKICFPRTESVCLPSIKPPVRDIYFLIPFISTSAHKALSVWAAFCKKKVDVNIHVITGTTSIPTIKDILNEEERTRFADLFQDGELGHLGQCLVVSDWRVPDYESIPTPFFEGKIDYEPPIQSSKPLSDTYSVFKPYSISLT